MTEFNKECKNKCLDTNGKINDKKVEEFFLSLPTKINNKIVKERCVRYEFFIGICLNDVLKKFEL